MSSDRLISIAAGVTPELHADPTSFVDAAAAAGWPATGVWYDPESWRPATTAALQQRLDATGLVAVDIEVIRIGAEDDHGEALIDAGIELGVRNVLAVSTLEQPAQTAARLAALCQRAQPGGVTVCLEFMRFTAVKNLTDALQVLRLADQPNAGILVDLLHVVRSGTSLEEIRQTDPALFPYAQWCDGPAQPRGWDTRDLVADALDDRAIPGEGELPADAFQDLFGPEVPFSLEVRSKALRDACPDPTDRARHLLRATRTALR